MLISALPIIASLALTPVVDSNNAPGVKRANQVRKMCADHRLSLVTCSMTLTLARKYKELGDKKRSAASKDEGLACMKKELAVVVKDMQAVGEDFDRHGRNVQLPVLWITAWSQAALLGVQADADIAIMGFMEKIGDEIAKAMQLEFALIEGTENDRSRVGVP